MKHTFLAGVMLAILVIAPSRVSALSPFAEYYNACREKRVTELQARLQAGEFTITELSARRNQAFRECTAEAQAMNLSTEEQKTPSIDLNKGEYVKIISPESQPSEKESLICIPGSRTYELSILSHPEGIDTQKAIAAIDDDGTIQWIPASATYEVNQGERIIVPQDETSIFPKWRVLVEGLGIQFYLDPGTLLKAPCERVINEGEKVILEEGYISFIGKSLNGKLLPIVHTKDAIAGVKGTTYTVERRNNTSTYRVVEGEIEVTPVATSTPAFTVAAGQKAVVSGADARIEDLKPEEIPSFLATGTEPVAATAGEDSGRGLIFAAAAALLAVVAWRYLRRR